jgi:hypothetical protein
MTEILDSVGINLANRFMASQFPVWGADGSKWEDRADTPKFPDLSIVPQLGGSFMGWKITQGAGAHGFIDRTALEAWKRMRAYNESFPEKMIARLPFHFWDYSPANYTGSAELFGAEQAKFFWNTIKSDPGEMPGALDAESFAAWFYLNWLNQSKPMAIAGGFRKQFADLAGYEAMLYTNPGTLPFFGDQFKSMDLWLAWYNEKMTYADIQTLLKRNNWRGRALIWQYASDGDLDEDGIGDGLKLGMEEIKLDLNVWLENLAEFSAYCGRTPQPSIPVVEDPIPAPDPEPAKRTRVVELMNVSCNSGLNLRNIAGKPGSTIIGWLPNKKEVECLETVKLGSDIWRRVGQGQFVAELFDGVKYLG